jgi:tRNA pseudouridine38-40 synthase
VRFLLTIQYLGTRFAGWQLQANALTVQQVLEETFGSMFGAPLRVEGSGRTDAGVHARAQRAHVDIPVPIEPRGLILGANNLLPHDVRIVAAEVVADDFHARFAARGKRYVYRIWNAAVADVFTFETHAHVAQRLDAERMHAAAQALAGTHDFRAFTVTEPEVATTVRTIRSASVARDGDAIRIELAADGFLRYMVRRIAGTLIEIGRGKLPPDVFADARRTAPAKGLTLWEVEY